MCLTIFALISLATARADKLLSDEAARMVLGYYEADTLAEHIFAELNAANSVPARVLDIDITKTQDSEQGQTLVSFSCPVNERKELLVELNYDGGEYSILAWRLNDTVLWDSSQGKQLYEGTGLNK